MPAPFLWKRLGPQWLSFPPSESHQMFLSCLSARAASSSSKAPTPARTLPAGKAQVKGRHRGHLPVAGRTRRQGRAPLFRRSSLTGSSEGKLSSLCSVTPSPHDIPSFLKRRPGPPSPPQLRGGLLFREDHSHVPDTVIPLEFAYFHRKIPRVGLYCLSV